MINEKIPLERINSLNKNTLAEHLAITYTEIHADYLVAEMPVRPSTHQPYGVLHGGASVALAETVGSMAANLTVDTDEKFCVGLEINANHLRSVKEGTVSARAEPVHLGRSTQVWEIRIKDEMERLICISRLTIAVLDKK